MHIDMRLFGIQPQDGRRTGGGKSKQMRADESEDESESEDEEDDDGAAEPPVKLARMADLPGAAAADNTAVEHRPQAQPLPTSHPQSILHGMPVPESRLSMLRFPPLVVRLAGIVVPKAAVTEHG